jgi:membrane protease YdiL (CAAX protease family)
MLIMEEMYFKAWFKRPTLMAANVMFLLATGGQIVLLEVIKLVINPIQYFMNAETYAVFIYNFSLMITELVPIALPAVIYAARNQGVAQSMRVCKPSPRDMALAAVSALVGAYAFQYIGALWAIAIEFAGGNPAGSSIRIPITRAELMLSCVTVGILPGICEELLFRGAIMGAWERRGTKYALIMSSVLFALTHGSLAGLPTHLMLGFAIGYAAIASGSIYVAMMYHSAYNIGTLAMSFMAASTPEANTAAEGSLLLIDALGGISALPGLVTVAILFAAAWLGTLKLFDINRNRRKGLFDGVALPDKSKMPWPELVTFISGIITAGGFYLIDIFNTFL